MKVAKLQEVRFTIASGASSGTGTLSGFKTLSKVVPLFVSWRVADGQSPVRASNTEVDVAITNLTTITAERWGSPSYAINVTAYVVEFGYDTVVQKGTWDLTSSETSTTETITATTLANSFVVSYNKNEGESAPGYDSDPDGRCIAFKFNSTTQLGFSREAAKGAVSGHWYVIYSDTLSVQHGNHSETGTTLNSVTDTISTVNVSHSFLVSSFKTEEAQYHGLSIWTADLSSATTVRWRRYPYDSVTVDFEYQVITDTALTIQRGEFSTSSSVSTYSHTITSVDAQLTAAKTGCGRSGFMDSSSFEDGDLDTRYWEIWLSNSTTLNGQAGSSYTNAKIWTWETVTFDAVGHVGNIGHWQDSAGSQIPGTSWGAVAFASQKRNDGSTYSKPNTSTIEVEESGNYLVIATLRYSGGTNRFGPQGKIAVTTGSGKLWTSFFTGYNRDASEHEAWVKIVGVYHGAKKDDRLQIQHRRDNNSSTTGTVADACDVQIVKLAYTNIGMYQDSTGGSVYGGTSANTVNLDSNTIETNTAAIERSSDTVTVKGNNKRYLVLWCVAGQTNNSTRTQRIGQLNYGGTSNLPTRSYAFCRDSNNQYAGLGGVDVLATSTADIAIQVECLRGVGTAADQGGALLDGGWTSTANLSGLCVIELMDSMDVARSHDATGLQRIDSAATLNIVNTLDISDSASFTRASATNLNVVKGANVFVWAQVWSARSDVSSTARFTGYSTISIGGTAQTLGRHGNYSRGSEGTSSTFCGGVHQPGGIYDVVNAGDDITVDAAPLSGTESGGNIRTQTNSISLIVLSLSASTGISVDKSGTTYTISGGSADSPITLTQLQAATDSGLAVLNRNAAYTSVKEQHKYIFASTTYVDFTGARLFLINNANNENLDVEFKGHITIGSEDDDLRCFEVHFGDKDAGEYTNNAFPLFGVTADSAVIDCPNLNNRIKVISHLDGPTSSMTGEPGARNGVWLENNVSGNKIRVSILGASYSYGDDYELPNDTGFKPNGTMIVNWRIGPNVSVRDIEFRDGYVDWRPAGTWDAPTRGVFVSETWMKFLGSKAFTFTSPLIFGSSANSFEVVVGNSGQTGSYLLHGLFSTGSEGRIVYNNFKGLEWSLQMALYGGGDKIRVENHLSLDYTLIDSLAQPVDGAVITLYKKDPVYNSANNDVGYTGSEVSFDTTTDGTGKGDIGQDDGDLDHAIAVEAFCRYGTGGNVDVDYANKDYSRADYASYTSLSYTVIKWGQKPIIKFSYTAKLAGETGEGKQSLDVIQMEEDTSLSSATESAVPTTITNAASAYDNAYKYALDEKINLFAEKVGDKFKSENTITFDNSATDLIDLTGTEITMRSNSFSSDLESTDGDVKFKTAFNISDITISSDLRIDVGSNASLTFDNVTITSGHHVYNDDASHTLTITAINGSSVVAGDPGTGNGQTQVLNNRTHTLTGIVEGSEVTYTRLPAASDTGSDGASTADSRLFATSSAWTVDEWQGHLLKIASGADAGRYYIISNTATTLKLDAELTATATSLDYAIYNEDNSTVVHHIESVTSSGESEYTYDYSSDFEVDILVHALNYVSVAVLGVIMGSDNQTLPISQKPDGNYYNPA